QQSDHRPGHGQAVIRPPAGLMPTVVSPPCDLVSDDQIKECSRHARLHRIQTAPARVCGGGGGASFITSAALNKQQHQQQHRLRRIRRWRFILAVAAPKAAGTPKRTRTHLHGRLFSPAFEDPTPAAVDAAGNDDNNNSGKQQLAAADNQAAASWTKPGSPAVPASLPRAAGADSGESSDDGGSEEEAEEEEIEATAVGANDGAGDGAAPIAEPTQPPVTDENAMACKNPLASSEHEQLLARKYTDPEEFSFIRSLPPAPPASPQRIPVLPKKTRRTPRCTLVLDLDETLVHSSVDNFLHGADLTFPVSFEFVEYKGARPAFMNSCTESPSCSRVVLFTASIRDYADALLDILDPEKRFIRHRLFREHCVSVQGNYIKDLSILDRDMSATVIVDNSPQALSNGIPISSWYTDSEDRELFKLLPFLEFIASQDTDVRTVISQKFRLHERVSAAPALQTLELW
uniref:FCP1 homology domain-containing protein n=1 Tax=Macrostomum lignano TaxID=282301 RepID=A0A1I8FFC8_9PLAT